MRGLNYIAATAVSLFTLANLAVADDKDPPTQHRGQWFAGVGVLAKSQPYQEVDADFFPLPYVAYFGERFFFEMNDIGYSLAKSRDYRIGLVVSARLDGYDSDDSNALAGMAERKYAVDGGLQFSISGDWGKVEFTGLTDISDTHDGHEFSATYRKLIFINRSMITPVLGARWQSDELMDYYYGVRQQEAKVGRVAYQANATITWFAEMEVVLSLAQKWSLTANVVYEKLSGEYTDSPIVENNYLATVFAGLIYKF